jgi:hypothetical protein
MDLARCARSLPLTITCQEARDNTFDQMLSFVHSTYMVDVTSNSYGSLQKASTNIWTF